MTYVKLNLPDEAQVIGDLCDRTDADYLTQDMLQVELPGNVFIDVGWYPDLDPKGEYRIVVFKDRVENQIEPMFASRDVAEVEETIGRIVDRHLQPVKQQGSWSSISSRFARGVRGTGFSPVAAPVQRYQRVTV